MKVVVKNFFRNEIVNLTARSLKHFIPDVDIAVMNLCKTSSSDYDSEVRFDFSPREVFYDKTKYHGMGSAVGNDANGLFFSEGYNFVLNRYRDCDEKVLILAEDHFFTTGTTLRELQEKDFDIAYAPWDSSESKGANGSLLCFRPKRIFSRVPEVREPIEGLLMRWIDGQNVRKHALSTRAQLDYKGDGFYTNSSGEIKAALQKANIL